MKTPFIAILAAFAQTCFAQAPPQALTATVYPQIRPQSRLDGCLANYPCIDNRSQFSRQDTIHSYRAYGTGTWSVDMQWADGTPTVWVSYGNTAVVTNVTPSSAIGTGLDPSTIAPTNKNYHDYIRFVMTGSVIIENYVGTKNVWLPVTAGTISYPLTVNQGGTGASTTTGWADNLYFLSALTGAVARTAESKLSDIVSVMDFGATGDGSTDDTAAFTSACGTRRQVLIPAGTYKIGDVTCAYGSILTGAGAKQTTLLKKTGATTVITLAGNGDFSTTALSRVSVTGDSSGTGVSIPSSWIQVRDVQVSGFATCVLANNAVNSSLADSILSGCGVDLDITGVSYEFKSTHNFYRTATTAAVRHLGTTSVVSINDDIEGNSGAIGWDAGSAATWVSPHFETSATCLKISGTGIYTMVGGSFNGCGVGLQYAVNLQSMSLIRTSFADSTTYHVVRDAGTLNLSLQDVTYAGTGTQLSDAVGNTYLPNFFVLGDGSVRINRPFTWTGITGDWANTINAETGHGSGTSFSTNGVRQWLVSNDYQTNFDISRYVGGVFQETSFQILNASGNILIAKKMALAGLATTPQAALDFPTGEAANFGTGHGLVLTKNKGSAWSVQNLINTGFSATPGDYVDITVPGSSANTTKLRLTSLQGIQLILPTNCTGLASRTLYDSGGAAPAFCP